MKRLFEKYRELIIYLIVGLLTTAVAYGVRLAILYGFAGILSIDLSSADSGMMARASALRTVSQTVGWVAGVLFAFFPNKLWVFRDSDTAKGRTLRQFGAFALSRLGTYFVELGLAVLLPMLLVLCGYRPFRLLIEFDADTLSMCISIVLVTILNYIISKLLVFRKK